MKNSYLAIMLLLSLNYITANNEKNQNVTAQQQDENITDFILSSLLESNESDWYELMPSSQNNLCTRNKIREGNLKKRFIDKSLFNKAGIYVVKRKSKGHRQKTFIKLRASDPKIYDIEAYLQIKGIENIKQFREKTNKFRNPRLPYQKEYEDIYPSNISWYFQLFGKKDTPLYFAILDDRRTTCIEQILKECYTHEKPLLMVKCRTEGMYASDLRTRKKE